MVNVHRGQYAQPTKEGFRCLRHDMTKPGILLALTTLERRNFNERI